MTVLYIDCRTTIRAEWTNRQHKTSAKQNVITKYLE